MDQKRFPLLRCGVRAAREKPADEHLEPDLLRALATEAELLIARHDLESAAGCLSLTNNITGERLPTHGFFRLLVAACPAPALAGRAQLGHAARAKEIEQELRELLALADPDFALLRDLD